MLGPPTGFWGKLESVNGVAVAWHPLAHHCADVAACCEALLEQTLLRQRLARTAGLYDLSPIQVARLCSLAAFHDLGKFNRGFQNKAFPGRTPWAGHLAEFLALLDGTCSDTANRERLAGAFPFPEVSAWGDDLLGLFVATISHHGRPVQPEPRHCDRSPECWTPGEDVDPFAGISELVALVRTWFPEAWAENGEQLPTSPPFQHAWCGLLTLADWLGSDSRPGFFPFGDVSCDRMAFARERATQRLRDLGLDATSARRALGADSPGYERVLGVVSPRPAQLRMLDLRCSPVGAVVVLEAPTGSGKTEAALAHFLRLFHAGLVDGMYFALPTRAAASQIYERVYSAARYAFGDAAPPVVQAVTGYIKADGVVGVPLPPFTVLWPDDPADRLHARGWAAENPKRFLAGSIVVGTIDQVLLSTLKVRHAHLRRSAVLRQLLVVDEVHASDVYMTRLLESVLDAHLAAGGQALLMSATLGAASRARLLAPPGRRAAATCPAPEAAAALSYPAISCRVGGESEVLDVQSPATEKIVYWELLAALERPREVAARALAAAVAGARVLIIKNTVSSCLDMQVELEATAGDARDRLFSCTEVACPHHSRFANVDRSLLDARVQHLFGRGRRSEGRGLVAVATQTVEQSLDLDADFLITDLCPMDVLLQRVGRLHRHKRQRPDGFEVARVLVLVPAVPDLSPYLTEKGTPRGGHGLGTVYESLLALQATWDALAARPHSEIPGENRQLVEAAVHPEALHELALRMGSAWLMHERNLRGIVLAKSQGATLNLLRSDLSFSQPDVRFPESGDAQIRTRLGWEDRVARLPAPALGPFGHEINELHVAHHLFQGELPEDPDELASQVATHEGGFTFRFGTWFRYDRLGLRREESP